MKSHNSKIAIIITILFLGACHSKKKHIKDPNSIIIDSPYFGQKTPGLIPEIFAPGIVSVNGRYEYALSFSPDFKEMYFSGEKEGAPQTVYLSQLENDKWTKPSILSLSKGRKKNEFEAFVNLNNDKIYFAAYDSIFYDEKIWVSKRESNSWSQPIPLESPINDDLVFYPNTSANGDLFYTSISEGKIYYAPHVEGKYPEVHPLEIEYGGHGFIAPHQDFILVDAPKGNDQSKDKDIHVSFKNEDGTWSRPLNLGNTVNSNYDETCPSLTPDGKYLFFSRYNEAGGLSNIYWVSAGVIQQVRIDANISTE